MMRRAALALASAAMPAPMPALAQPQPVPATAPGAVTAMVEKPCPADRAPETDWPGLCHYQDDNRRMYHGLRAVMIGDSITAGWLPTSPGLFAAGIADRGISGQTCQQIMGRFYQDVVRLRPRVVHIMCGTNDVAGNTGPTSPADYANAILAMTDLAHANGIAVVLGSILPAGAFTWRPGYQPASEIISLNTWLRDLAQQRGLIFADYHSAMAGPDGAMRPGLSVDGVHPNAAGYAVMDPIARAAIAAAERQRVQ